MAYNSTIKQKHCACSPDCKKFPTTGFAGFYYSHAPLDVKERMGLKAKKSYQNRREKQQKANLSRRLHDASKEVKAKIEPKTPIRSDLLKKADNLFSKFIRKRDANEMGFVKCVCCGNSWHLTDKNLENEVIIQCLHFVSRETYSLRYSENNAKAGCCYCNLNMHLFPEGKEFNKFREALCMELGVETVYLMLAEKRNINRLTHGDIEAVITRYSPTKL